MSSKRTCIHCDYPLEANYKFCPNCSQKTAFKRFTLGRFLDDFFNSVISYDSKGINTLRSMLRKPGQAALTFVNGDSIKYVNPFRLYLYISFLYFFISNLAETTREVFFEEGKIIKLSEVKKEKEKPTIRTNNFNFFGDKINTKGDSIVVQPAKAFDSLSSFKKAIKISANFKDYRTLYPDKSKEECFAELGFKDNFWNNYLYKKSDFSLDNDEENFVEHVLQKVPLLLFFNIPIISLLLLLVQFRQPFNFTESMILMFHYMAIVFFMLIFAEILDVIDNGTFFSEIVFTFIMPLYFYKTLRNFYQQSRMKTILKFVILSFLFLVSVSVMFFFNFVFLFLTY